MRVLLVLAALATTFSGCTAFDNGCPDGIWGAFGIGGTQEQVDEDTFRATGAMLCGHKFSVHDVDGTLRLEAIDEDARGPLRWGDLRFEVGVDGIVMKQFPNVESPMKPDTREPPDFELETELEIGDEIGFCRTPEAQDPHVHVELTQTRYTAHIHDSDGATASFESLPACS